MQANASKLMRQHFITQQDEDLQNSDKERRGAISSTGRVNNLISLTALLKSTLKTEATQQAEAEGGKASPGLLLHQSLLMSIGGRLQAVTDCKGQNIQFYMICICSNLRQ